jgi:hypothetical protein
MNSHRSTRFDKRAYNVGPGGSSLKSHPLFEEIDNLLRTRYNPTSILKLLAFVYSARMDKLPPLPSARTLERYRQREIPEVDLLPARLIEKRIEKINRSVDVFASVQLVYVAAEARLARLLEQEDRLPWPMSDVDKAFATVGEAGDQLWRIGQDIGVFPNSNQPLRHKLCGSKHVGLQSR